jgi:hypothetical protein
VSYNNGPGLLFPPPVPWAKHGQKRLFIVGAGLSKAVEPSMPTAAELVEALQHEQLGHAVVTGNLETSLAYLAGNHPFDRAAEAWERKALLDRCIGVIAKTIAKRSEKAASPIWFKELLVLLEASSARVVSFNYDLLLEQTQPTLVVHKPHGSLDLCWRPGREGSIQHCVGSVSDLTTNSAKGLEPFIVPPTTAKSDYYSVDALSMVWHVFRDAVETANEIVLLGFSAAEADSTVNGLLRSSKAKGVVIVDYSTTSIAAIQARLTRIGLTKKAGFAGVKTYVDTCLVPAVLSDAFDPRSVQAHLQNPGVKGFMDTKSKFKLFVNTRGPQITSIKRAKNGVVVVDAPAGGVAGTFELSVEELLAKTRNASRIQTETGELVVGWEVTPTPAIHLLTHSAGFHR